MAISFFTVRVLAKLKEGHEDDEKRAMWTQRAEATWRDLVLQNADCNEYYKGLLANQGIDLGLFGSLPLSSNNDPFLANINDENRKRALDILRAYFSAKPDTAPHRLFLDVSTGQDFIELIKPYLTNGLTKGIPSLFADVKPLYKDPFKRQVIQDTAEVLRTAYSPTDHPAGNSVDPTAYLWTLYFLAQHYSFLGHHKHALEILDTATEHTPTLPELYMMRARTLKRAGDPFGAVKAMEAARMLDGQDRFINTKTGKYFLRAGMPEKADEILHLFTKVRGLHEVASCHSFISERRRRCQ